MSAIVHYHAHVPEGRGWWTIARERGVQPTEVAIAVETEPADLAQVDFGYAG